MAQTDLISMGQRGQTASRRLATVSTEQKNAALRAIANGLRQDTPAILKANAEDVARAERAGLTPAMIDRLLLTPERIAGIAAEVEHVAALPDPVGERFDETVLPNGMRLHKRRTPLGVIGVIYESRPNVTVDVASLCLKAGNAAILRGGSETTASNTALGATIARAMATCEMPEAAVQVITDPDRALVLELLRLHDYVSMIIPRGGAGLHKFCRENATVPVITGGLGVCHTYVDPTADLQQAVPLIHNAKVQRPSACNSLDTLLVHRAVAEELLPRVVEDLAGVKVEIRADESAMPFMPAGHPAVHPAGPDDFGQEFLALILSVRVVDSLDEAIAHIERYGTQHSDAILTSNAVDAARFVSEVDSAAVFVNASTRFNDGGQFGLGAEVAVSTQKLQARGPMGLNELTTYKWVAGSLEEGEEPRYFVRK
jgi:glutamate-5-semialdehyde dehydrogenase